MAKKFTKCKNCGVLIEYTTKKPNHCGQCKLEKNTVRKPVGKAKKASKTKWKSESEMYRILDELLPKTQYCTGGYYSWLPSPKNQPMQLDWYSYELGLALEFQGIQHYKHTKYFQKTKQDFLYQQECDKLKKEICAKEGIVLVSIKYNTDLNVRTLARCIKEEDKIFYNSLIKEKQINLSQEDIESIDKSSK